MGDSNTTFKVEPHVLRQAYKAIKTSAPKTEELKISENLNSFMKKYYPTETSKNIERRSIILTEIRQIFRDWVQKVCLTRGLNEDMASDVGGQIYVSGSYRLGVNEPGADIDTICVAPKHVTREDFFTSLKLILMEHSRVKNLVAIENAAVPLITFDYEEINIDLQIAILPRNTIPDNLNILDDQILLGVDPATEKSLNGPRVTELIIKLTPNRHSFITVLRIVRRWAKRRGIYSNKMGYLGGINWCILVCFINQLYPTASPVTLLLRFFMILANWKWPLAIQLNKSYDIKLGLNVWNATQGSNRYQAMPILTPAYPSMNSSYNVSMQTLEVLKREFKRGYDIVDEIITSYGKKKCNIVDGINEGWSKLFEPSDFFAVQQHYLAVDVYVSSENGSKNSKLEEDEQAWVGYCESRVRKLVESLAFLRPLCKIRAFPKKFPLYFTGGEPSISTPTATASNPRSSQNPLNNEKSDSKSNESPPNTEATSEKIVDKTSASVGTESSGSKATTNTASNLERLSSEPKDALPGNLNRPGVTNPVETPETRNGNSSSSSSTNGTPSNNSNPTVRGCCFYIGFDIDKLQIRNNNKELHIDTSVNYFTANELRFNKKKRNMLVKITPLLFKNLPNCVFNDLNGKDNARKIRKEHIKKSKAQAPCAATSANGNKVLNNLPNSSKPETVPVQKKKGNSLMPDTACNSKANDLSKTINQSTISNVANPLETKVVESPVSVQSSIGSVDNVHGTDTKKSTKMDNSINNPKKRHLEEVPQETNKRANNSLPVPVQSAGLGKRTFKEIEQTSKGKFNEPSVTNHNDNDMHPAQISKLSHTAVEQVDKKISTSTVNNISNKPMPIGTDRLNNSNSKNKRKSDESIDTVQSKKVKILSSEKSC